MRLSKFWNWKAAAMSALYRAPIFFISSLKHGWRAALSAAFVEVLFRTITSGVNGAITQALRKMQPTWLAIFIVLVAFPAAVQVLEFMVHSLRGTPNLKGGVILSAIVTGIASLFNWYAMRHGTLLTGKEGRSFWADLKVMPIVIGKFIAAAPIFLWRLSRRTL